MKKTYNITKALAVGVLTLLLTSACQDWLTVYPQTQIVEENFWEDKNDLEGVRYAAYKNMCGTLEKIVLWGDLRSDSYVRNPQDNNTSTLHLYKDIQEGWLYRDSASTYFDWSPFYTTINYCNKVLQHGAEVLEKDKQFRPAEWVQMRAEITALRALNYFYLLRAYKDIPFSTKVINTDTEVQAFGATNQLVVLDSLILDVESVKGQARKYFTDVRDTKGLITNAAIYAMLSDMYLWRASLHEGRYGKESTDSFTINNRPDLNGTLARHTVRGDYQLCIDYADQAMQALNAQYEGRVDGGASFRGKDQKWQSGLDYISDRMYKNDFKGFLNGTEPKLDAYNAIFIEGNSEESIFELQFNNTDSRSNGVVNSLWGNNMNGTHLLVSQKAIQLLDPDGKRRDARLWFSAWSAIDGETNSPTEPWMLKYKGVSAPNPEDHLCTGIKVTLDSKNESYRNWIVYRLSDVMLQKAEALVALGGTANENLAMKYVNTLHRRWYCNDDPQKEGTQPQESVLDDNGSKPRADAEDATMGNYIANEDKEVVVMRERQIEFLGEGKRWFDLVRYAERHAGGQPAAKEQGDVREWTEQNPVNNGSDGLKAMVETFLKPSAYSDMYNALRGRMRDRYGLYNMIYYMEIKASEGMLQQNPTWNKSNFEH